MLDYGILSKKPTITVVKNNEYVTYKDLTTKIYNGITYDNGSFVIVEEYYVARPDLISLAVYGDDKYADILCKINGISNPFELNVGMVIFLPDIDAIEKSYRGSSSENDILDQFKQLNYSNNDSKSNYTLNSTSESISKRKKNLQKFKNERRSPGEQTVSDSNYIIDKTLGIVIY